jgi:hypothetical protein
LLGHRELWRATHGDDERSLTSREELYLEHLNARSRFERAEDDKRWSALVGAVDRDALVDPEYPRLAAQLTEAFDWGVDVDRLLPHLLADGDYASAPDVLAEVVEEAQVATVVREAKVVPSAAWRVLEPSRPMSPDDNYLSHDL